MALFSYYLNLSEALWNSFIDFKTIPIYYYIDPVLSIYHKCYIYTIKSLQFFTRKLMITIIVRLLMPCFQCTEHLNKPEFSMLPRFWNDSLSADPFSFFFRSQPWL